MPQMWRRYGKDGYGFNGGLIFCGRKLCDHKKKKHKTLGGFEKNQTGHKT